MAAMLIAIYFRGLTNAGPTALKFAQPGERVEDSGVL
jgi:hypothetical protein